MGPYKLRSSTFNGTLSSIRVVDDYYDPSVVLRHAPSKNPFGNPSYSKPDKYSANSGHDVQGYKTPNNRLTIPTRTAPTITPTRGGIPSTTRATKTSTTTTTRPKRALVACKSTTLTTSTIDEYTHFTLSLFSRFYKMFYSYF